jgi:isopenicillin-N epimerase
VSGIDADFWLGNLHKWAFAPRPTALLTVGEEHLPAMRPLVVSWEQEQGFPVAQEFAGTLDYTPWLAAPAGLHLLRTFGADEVRAHNADLATQGQRLVASAIAASAEDDLLELARDGRLGDVGVSMRLVPCPPGMAADAAAAEELRNRLATEYRIEVPVVSWQGRRFLRLSAQIYNSIEDYERLGDAVRQLL